MNRDARDAVAAGQGRPPAELLRELVERHIPVRRLGAPAEVAALIAFLAADEAAT